MAANVPAMTRVVDRTGRPAAPGSAAEDVAALVGAALAADGRGLAVADTVTGGLLVATLRRADPAGAWLRGAEASDGDAVAGPDAATDRAERALAGCGADVGLAVVGGGPDGLVWVAVVTPEVWRPHGHRLAGPPEAVRAAACAAALDDLLDALAAG